VLVEGVGGLMSPISDDEYNADLAAEFGYPLVIVAENALGTINATLQTLITARTYGGGLQVAGIVLNSPRGLEGDASVESNAAELTKRCIAPLLAVIGHHDGLIAELDWCAIAGNGGCVLSTEYRVCVGE
jgi:dethiobiotin synthetase